MPSPLPAGSVGMCSLDSFDEALKRGGSVQDLVELLDQWLRGWTRDTARPAAAAASRHVLASWENAALEEMLENYWRSDEVIMRDMAPLTRDDVLRAATVRGVPDPDGLAAGLEQRGLVPVASLPIPLTRALLDRAAEGHPLPATAKEVYRLACEQLCEEAGTGRVRRPEGLGLQEVMGRSRASGRRARILRKRGAGDQPLLTSPGGPVRLVDVAAAAETVTGRPGRTDAALADHDPAAEEPVGQAVAIRSARGSRRSSPPTYLEDRQLAPVNVQSLLFAGPAGPHVTSTTGTSI